MTLNIAGEQKLTKKQQSTVKGGEDACYDLDPNNGHSWDIVCGGKPVEDAVQDAPAN